MMIFDDADVDVDVDASPLPKVSMLDILEMPNCYAFFTWVLGLEIETYYR